MAYKVTDTIVVDQNRNLSSIGIATFAGPLLIGGGSSTGTVSQPLQVLGTNGAYIGGNLGIGSTNPSSKLWVSGDIYNAGIHTAQVLSASKDPGSGIATDFTNSLFGNGWRVSSPGSTTYYKLATLPAGGGGNTFDHLIINGVLGAWTNGNQTPFEITFANRGAFNYKYVSYGSVRSDVRIIGISTNSNVEIWAQHQASQFTKLVYTITNSIQAIVVSNPTSTTTTPVGTTVFDSSTVTPRFIINESDNVGIGTISPTSKLQIVGDVLVSGIVTANSFRGDGSLLTGIGGGISSVSISSNITNQSQYLTYAIGTGNTTGLGVTTTGLVFNPSSGNLGIGTTAPLQKLHVLGNLLVAAGSSTGQHITQKAYELNSGTLSWEGSAGQLFSITNNLTSGSIFSVNDVSGIPSIDVDANGTISLGAYGGNIGIGTTNATSKLDIFGNIKVVGIVTATTFSGTLSGYASSAGISTNLNGGLAGNIVYQSGANATAFLTNGSSGTVLQSNGVGNAPTWVAAAPSGAVSGITIRDSTNTIVGTSGSVTQLTFGTGLSVTGATGAAGIATITLSSNIVGTSLSISGISTFANGPVLIGSGTSTGTASQRLQVTGGAYVSGQTLINTSSTAQNAALVITGRDPGTGIYVNTSNAAGGIVAPAYGLFVEGQAWNNATIQYGVYAKQTQQVSATVYGGYFEAVATYSPTYGLYAKATKPDTNSGTFAYGLFATASGSSSAGSGGSYGAWIENTTTSATSSSYGLVVNTQSGPNTVVPFIINHANTERLRLDSSGNLLVGTATSTGTASQPLQVTGGAYVSGNLGVGATSPTEKLDIIAGTVPEQRRLKIGVDATTSSSTIYSTESGGYNRALSLGGSDIIFVTDGGGATTRTQKAKFDTSGNLLINNTTATGTASQPLQVTGGAYVFGSVGIGTTLPTSTLQVQGTVSVSSTTTSSEFVGGGSDLRNLSGTHLVSYASASDISNSALSIAGISTYSQVGILTGSLAVDASDSFGYSVATSADGKTIIVGAYADEIGATTSTGVVYVFDRVGSSFNQVGILTGSLAVNASDLFGNSVATSADGKTIIVGAYQDEIGATTSTGIAYVFDETRDTYVYSGPTGNIGIGSTNPSSKLSVVGDVLVSGVTTASRFVSNIATGTAPLTVTSTTKVTNLNADLLDDNDSTYYTNASNLSSGTVPSARITASSGDFTVGQNLFVNGSLSVGGTSIVLNAAQLRIKDRDITLGITTDANGNDISTDNTANHGGIAIASTEGTPFLNIPPQAGINTDPSTYKQLMWIKSGNYSGMGTDAWVFNYGVSIGNTATLQNLSRLTVGAGFTVYDTYLDTLDIRNRNLNVSGISTFQGQIQSTQANNTANGGGQIYLNGATGNRIDFSTAGVSAPAFTTRSVGIKLVLYPAIGASSADYGFGIESSTLWSSVPTTSEQFKWYAGTTNIATLTGTGNLTIGGGVSGSTATPTNINLGNSFSNGTTRDKLKIYLYNSVTEQYGFGVGGSGDIQYHSNSIHDFYINNSNAVRINSSANLLIGATSDTGTASQKLQVTGGAYISGSVGLGVVSPLTKLDSRGTILIATNSNGNNLLAFGNSTAFGPLSGAPDGSHGNSFIIGNSSTVSGAPSYLSFWTTSGGVVGERARIQPTGEISIGSTTTTGTSSQLLQVTGGAYVSGRLGIGTTNPGAKLDVSADALISGLTVGKGTGSVSTNTALGYQALLGNTTGSANVATGYQALLSNTTGVQNTANGYQALYSNTTGINNTATGFAALYANTTGSNNTATGTISLRFNTTGSSNTASGYASLFSNTTGGGNTANGYFALQSNTTGTNNTATGRDALTFNTTGIKNTATGVSALATNTTGGSNTANGYQALYSNTTGASNTATGLSALQSNTTGINNTATGVQALYSNTTGTVNTATGYQALYSNTTGYRNTANGYRALYSNTTALNNTATGWEALRNNTTAEGNTADGWQALNANTTGANNTATGWRALYSNTTGIRNTANGYAALYSNTTGTNNTATGFQAFYSNTTGSNNTANGYRALYTNTTGTNNTATGSQTLTSNTTGIYNTATGYQALNANTTGQNNTATGVQALYSNTTGISNTANGYRALYTNTTGTNNTATGSQTLTSNTTGGNNTANGYRALIFNTTGINNTATGVSALQSNTTGTNNTATGFQALTSNTTGVNNTATGYQALYTNTTGTNNTAIGISALQSNTTGGNNTANGNAALYYNTTGTSNTATGTQALQNNTIGTFNTATGLQALYSSTTGYQNTATGYAALFNNTIGYENTANGINALANNTTGAFNTAIGSNAGSSITTGSNNSFLGYNAQPSSATVSNEITLGDTNVNTLRVPGLGFYGVRTNTTVATTSATTIDSIVVATYRSARIQIQITQGSNYQVSDVLLIHDGTTASIIEYGTLATGSTLGTYSATISSGNALLQVTMGSATSSAVKVLSYRTVV
jgi:hypothetical protein